MFKFSRLAFAVALFVGACTPATYDANGRLIVPPAPTAASVAESAQIDKALRSRMTRFDTAGNLDAVGAVTLATAILCRGGNCPRGTEAQVFARGTLAVVAATVPIPVQDVSLTESRANVVKARERAKWLEDILEISTAYVQMAERDAKAITDQKLDPAAWAVLYQTRSQTLTEALGFMRPVATNLRQLGLRTRYAETRPAYAAAASRAEGALRATVANSNKLNRITADLAAATSE